jgi:hypothetical protein
MSDNFIVLFEILINATINSGNEICNLGEDIYAPHGNEEFMIFNRCCMEVIKVMQRPDYASIARINNVQGFVEANLLHLHNVLIKVMSLYADIESGFVEITEREYKKFFKNKELIASREKIIKHTGWCRSLLNTNFENFDTISKHFKNMLNNSIVDIENRRMEEVRQKIANDKRQQELKELEDREYAINRGRVRAETERLQQTMKIYLEQKRRGIDMEAEFLELTRQRDFENMARQSDLLSGYVKEFKSIGRR